MTFFTITQSHKGSNVSWLIRMGKVFHTDNKATKVLRSLMGRGVEDKGTFNKSDKQITTINET